MAILDETLDAVALHFCTAMNVIFQLMPAPECNFADYHYKQQICFTDEPKKVTKKIASWITGLMNTSGGWIILYCLQPVYFNDVDKWVMGFEKIMKEQWISASTWNDLIPPFQKINYEDQFRIYIYVCKSPHLVSFDFKAFQKQEASTTAITDEGIIIKMLSEEQSSYYPTCISAFADKFSSFQFNESLPAPWFESRKLEFKQVYKKDGKRSVGVETFESNVLVGRLGEYMNYLSAFANCDGGSLVLGVEECGKKLLVKGFKVKENHHDQEREETFVTDYLKKRLGECIWHADPNYEPSEVDWKVFFPVVQEDSVTRKLVEVCVNKHIGGMFLGTPTYYVVNSRNELEEKPPRADQNKRKKFPDWQREFSRDHTIDEKQHSLDDHVVKPRDESVRLVGNIVSQVRSGGSALRSDVSQDTTEANTPESDVLLDSSATLLDSNADENRLSKSFNDSELLSQGRSGESALGRDVSQDKTQASTPESDVLLDSSAILLEGIVDETRLPKSFSDGEMRHKTSIFIRGLSLHKCCTEGMSKIIQQKLQNTETQAWYPSLETAKQRLGNVERWDDLLQVIQAKAWNGVASVLDRSLDTGEDYGGCNSLLDDMHSTLLFSVIIIDESETAKLLCCFDNGSTDKDKLVKYALCYGRSLKGEFVNCPANGLLKSHPFRFDVEVLQIPVEGKITTLWNSKNHQPVAYPNATNATQYRIALNGLVERLLKARHSVRDRYGEILIEHLTEKQAELLLDIKEPVLVVSGESGTGKTVLALQLIQRALQEGYTEQEVIFICSSQGLEAWITYQLPCQVLLVKSTDGLLTNQVEVLKKGKLIIADDVHAIHLGKDWEKDPNSLYTLLFEQAAICSAKVVIFFDPDQDFEENLPARFERKLRDLAEDVEGLSSEDIKIKYLTDRLRNSHEISRFLQANQSMAGVHGTITCFNEIQGDDVTYEYTGRSVKESALFIHARLNALEQKYKPSSVVVLCDDHGQVEQVNDLLTRNFYRTLQRAYHYPVKYTVVCHVDDFRGLEADVILCLMYQQLGRDEIKSLWKYRNFISSRARMRLEFLLQWKPVEGDLLQWKVSKASPLNATEPSLLRQNLFEPNMLRYIPETISLLQEFAGGILLQQKPADGSLSLPKPADGSLALQKLADGSLPLPKLTDGSLPLQKLLKDFLLLVQKLADSKLPLQKLLKDSLGLQKLLKDSPPLQKLLKDSPPLQKLLKDSLLLLQKLADSSLPLQKLADGCLPLQKLSEDILPALRKLAEDFALEQELAGGNLPLHQLLEHGMLLLQNIVDDTLSLQKLTEDSLPLQKLTEDGLLQQKIAEDCLPLLKSTEDSPLLQELADGSLLLQRKPGEDLLQWEPDVGFLLQWISVEDNESLKHLQNLLELFKQVKICKYVYFTVFKSRNIGWNKDAYV